MRSFSKPFIFLPIYMYVMNCSWFQQIDFEKEAGTKLASEMKMRLGQNPPLK